MLLKSLNRIEDEKAMLEDKPKEDEKRRKTIFKGFALKGGVNNGVYEQTLMER